MITALPPPGCTFRTWYSRGLPNSSRTIPSTAAVLAAICSTADSQLVVAASSAAHDLYARLFARSGRTAHQLVNQLVVVILGASAVLMVINQKVQVYQYVLKYGWAMLGASFGPQVILATMWKRASRAGCFAGMLVGFGVTIAWAELYDKSTTGVEIYNLPLAFICAFVVNVVVSLLVPDPPAARGFPVAPNTATEPSHAE